MYTYNEKLYSLIETIINDQWKKLPQKSFTELPSFHHLKRFADLTNEVHSIHYNDREKWFKLNWRPLVIDHPLGNKHFSNGTVSFPADTHHHWSRDHYEMLGRINPEENGAYERAVDLALNIIDRFDKRKGVSIVCGPISTGPGTVRQKLYRFHKTIQRLKGMGFQVFDQMPFEPLLERFHIYAQQSGGSSYTTNILTSFYWKIFEAGVVTNFFFMHGWEESYGAREEYKKVTALGYSKIPLPKYFIY